MSSHPENPLVSGRGGLQMPSLGLATWTMGADPTKRSEEVRALKLGIELGMMLIDTAENYADGGSEKIVGEAVASCRDEVVLVTKIHPTKATRQGTIRYAERSLRYLGTDRIDLYLLHDRPEHPAEETLIAFERLREDGKILHYGVSNHDLALMQEWEKLPLGRNVCCNQLRYALTHRALEREILPWCESIPIQV
jgi:aryl-alcohol dehydrogenase-like predicted oxidoreductase